MFEDLSSSLPAVRAWIGMMPRRHLAEALVAGADPIAVAHLDDGSVAALDEAAQRTIEWAARVRAATRQELARRQARRDRVLPPGLRTPLPACPPAAPP